MSLISTIKKKSKELIQQGHIIFYPSTLQIYHDDPFTVHIRYAPTLAKKPQRNENNSEIKRNPFLPPEKNLVLIDSWSDKYRLIFNKFSIMEYHIMLITKEYISQDVLLELDDFRDICSFMNELHPSPNNEEESSCWPLGFYNSGPNSGASQSHRHFQFLLLDYHTSDAPMRQWISRSSKSSDILSQIDDLDILHVVHHFSKDGTTFTPDHVCMVYKDMIKYCENRVKEISKINYSNETDNNLLWMSYNLVLTREWMLLVPRSTDSYGPVSVNALGFVGLFLTKTQQDTEWLMKQKLHDFYQAVCYHEHKIIQDS